jgi:RES domain-containing protein
MACCAGCFSNPDAKALVRALKGSRGDCDHCGRQRVKIVDESELREPFETLAGQYGAFGEVELGPFADGLSAGVDTLINHLQYTWGIFSEDMPGDLPEPQADLLDAILTGGRYFDPKEDDRPLGARDLCVSRRDSIYRVTAHELWSQKRAEFAARGSKLTLDESWMWALHRAEVKLKRGSALFRARLGYRENDRGRSPWDARRLGAPPPSKAKAGRANVKGTPVFYAADNEETAISEVRPALGHIVSVGTFRLKQSHNILDLAQPITLGNPFSSTDAWEAEEMGEYLQAFGAELARPLTRDDRPTRDYKASQVLCRTIRRAGYGGVRYPSAMRQGGTNVVLFDPRAARLIDARLVEITSLSLAYEDEDLGRRLAR